MTQDKLMRLEQPALAKMIENKELVEVVRCKDCRYLGTKDFVFGYCKSIYGLNGILQYDSFCCNGKRKESEGE